MTPRTLTLGMLLWAAAAQAQEGVAATRHNLARSGPGPLRAEAETQVCFFCHVPHRGGRGGNNRPETSASYTPYTSTTQQAQRPERLSESTRLCLSCHDGTIAVGQTRREADVTRTAGTGSDGRMGNRPANLGTDLRRSHPVSVAVPAGFEIKPPAAGPVKLDARGRVQCTSCHDPHQSASPLEGNFLVMSNRQGELCLSCHAKAFWWTQPSAHQSSNAQYNTRLGASTPFNTIAENACMACHQMHGAQTPARLVRGGVSQVCLPCHSGKVAQTDIRADLAKSYAHPVGAAKDVHDAAEGPQSTTTPLPETRASAPRHVECVDCHNPHAANGQPAAPPRVGGALAGVWGIDRNGERVNPAQFEYEICFKCHGDSANRPQRLGPRPPNRVRRATTDVRQAFDLGAVSFHPVEGPGRNPDVPGLLPPLSATSVILCTDCHASDTGAKAGGTGPKGPHGSAYPGLLERNLSTADGTPENVQAYALCYKCHDRDVLFSPQSGFPSHAQHVQKSMTPCTACHEWHGVSALQGTPANNAHLVNFDLAIAKPSASGALQYTSQGPRSGTCSVACHGMDHRETRY